MRVDIRLFLPLLSVLLLLRCAGSAVGSPQPGESLEWMVADSDLVVRGTIAACPSVLADDDTEHGGDVTIRVTEILKGPQVGEVTLPALWSVPRTPGGDLLLFLVRTNGPRPKQYDFHRNRPSLRGYPYSLRRPWNVISINADLGRRVITMEWKRLRTPDELLAAARRAGAEEGPDIPLEPLHVIPPRRLADYPYQDFTTLAFPVDHRLQRRAREWIEEPNWFHRKQAVDALVHFPSDANAGLLLPLLEDPYHETHGRTPWTRRRYPVREAAEKALSKWGIQMPPAITSEPAGIYRSLSPILVALCVALLSVGWWCVGAARQTPADPARRRLRFARAGVVWATAGAGAFALLDWRSRQTLDDVVFTTGDRAHKITSDRGRLRYMLISDWSLPTAPVRASFDLKELKSDWLDVTYHGSYAKPFVERRRWNFEWLVGEIDQPYHPAMRPYWALTVPHWFVVALCAVVAARLMPRWLRVRRRTRAGACHGCGYDLRASINRCPECGQEFLRSAAAL